MSTIHRPTNEHDLVDYLQKNYALSKTILRKLQVNSSDEDKTKDEKYYEEALSQLKSEFTSSTKK